MSSSVSTWIGVVSLVLFLALMSGFWAGIAGLWKTKRGAAWWLMAIGIVFGTIGPVLYSAGSWMLVRSLSASLSSGGATPPTPSFGFSALPGLLMAGGLLIPVGLVLFSIGFAIHGFATARTANRAAELEQLAAAMSEEITRLRQGGASA
jgi:hypothetical protein